MIRQEGSHPNLGLPHVSLDDVKHRGQGHPGLHGDLETAFPGEILLHDGADGDGFPEGPAHLGIDARIVDVPGAGLARRTPERHAVRSGEPFVPADLAHVGHRRLVPAVGAARRAPDRRFHVAEPCVLTPVTDLEVRHAFPSVCASVAVRVIGAHGITSIGSIFQSSYYYTYILTFRLLDYR